MCVSVCIMHTRLCMCEFRESGSKIRRGLENIVKDFSSSLKIEELGVEESERMRT